MCGEALVPGEVVEVRGNKAGSSFQHIPTPGSGVPTAQNQFSFTAHPSDQQNLPLPGAQQDKSCDKVTGTREILSQDWGTAEKAS